METINFLKLKREVLDRGGEAALPKNLSDEWLYVLARDLDNVLNDDNPDDRLMTVPLALILKILSAKPTNKGREISITDEELLGYFESLNMEISLELLSRNTDAQIKPATLDTIFTNRIVGL